MSICFSRQPREHTQTHVPSDIHSIGVGKSAFATLIAVNAPRSCDQCAVTFRSAAAAAQISMLLVDLHHLELTGIRVDEAATADIDADRLWLRGGYPDSLLAATDSASFSWRADIVRSYLEREVPLFAPRIPRETLRRLWTMVAHTSGGLLNASALGQALVINGQTVDRYLDLLADLYLVRRLPSWHANVRKRVTKAPKILVRDSGLLHALLGLETLDDVLSHPVAGHSYESFVVENIVAATEPDYRPHHYRTARGDEIDLVLERGGKPAIAIEVKRSTAPEVSVALLRARDDLGTPDTFLVHPDTGDDPYTVKGVTVIGLHRLMALLGTGHR